MRHDFADGKYTVINDNGKLTALRNGEPWRDLVGDNLIAAMLYEVDALRATRALELEHESTFDARVAALPRLQQQAGAAYTLYLVASKALQGASGDPKAVNWDQVHQDVFAKAVGQDKQPMAQVLVAIKLHSPGAVTPQQIAAAEAMGESGKMQVNHVEVRRAIRNLTSTTQAGKGRGMFESWRTAETQANAVYLTLFTDAERSQIVEIGRKLSLQYGNDDEIESFEDAIKTHGTSLIDITFPEEALGPNDKAAVKLAEPDSGPSGP